jgi:hypothetical protein
MLREYPIPGQGSALAQSEHQGRETSRSSVLGLGSRGRSAADGVGLTPTRSGRGMAAQKLVLEEHRAVFSTQRQIACSTTV